MNEEAKWDMRWLDDTGWYWRAERVSDRDYPMHGSDEISGGKLTGSTSTDYFHFNCPRCGPSGWGLDCELLGIRNDSSDKKREAPIYTIMLGLTCPNCGFKDLVKIGPLEREGYQRRRKAGWI